MLLSGCHILGLDEKPLGFVHYFDTITDYKGGFVASIGLGGLVCTFTRHPRHDINGRCGGKRSKSYIQSIARVGNFCLLLVEW